MNWSTNNPPANPYPPLKPRPSRVGLILFALLGIFLAIMLTAPFWMSAPAPLTAPYIRENLPASVMTPYKVEVVTTRASYEKTEGDTTETVTTGDVTLIYWR